VSYFASCAGLQIVSGSLMVPLVGAWTADLQLATQQQVSGQVAVVIGNLTLQGTVYRSEFYGGQVRARIVGGYGGWRTQAPAQGYGNDNGIKLSTVLQDLATAVGEKVNIVADTNIGNAFARVAFGTSVASDVLWQLTPGWHVDPAGVTQTAAWPSLNVTTPFTVTDQKPDEGVIEIATEDYASWLPGCVFTSPLLNGSYTSAGVHYTWSNDGKFRFEVLTGGTADRVLGPIQQVIQKEIAAHKFFGRYEYTISNPQPTTIDGAPVDTALGLPELTSVPLMGDALASYTPPDGGKAHVMFLDGNPAKPVCVWTEVSSKNGPTAITIAPQGTGANNVARVTDSVVVLFPPLMQIAGTLSGAPFIGVLTITTPAIGSIMTGSSLLQAAQS
jgi:hypothetical protein